jgi:hypothetical protein
MIKSGIAFKLNLLRKWSSSTHAYITAGRRRCEGEGSAALYDGVNAFLRLPVGGAVSMDKQLRSKGPRYWSTHLWAPVYTSVWWERQSSGSFKTAALNCERVLCTSADGSGGRRRNGLPIFNLLHQRETLKRLNSSKDVGIESSKWISMLKSHQFGPWITWKDSRYSTANEKGISQSRAIDSGFFPIRTFIYRASYSWRSGSSLAIQGSAFAYV